MRDAVCGLRLGPQVMMRWLLPWLWWRCPCGSAWSWDSRTVLRDLEDSLETSDSQAPWRRTEVAPSGPASATREASTETSESQPRPIRGRPGTSRPIRGWLAVVWSLSPHGRMIILVITSAHDSSHKSHDNLVLSLLLTLNCLPVVCVPGKKFLPPLGQSEPSKVFPGQWEARTSLFTRPWWCQETRLWWPGLNILSKLQSENRRFKQKIAGIIGS